jgi:hypothetical protein
VKVEDNVELEQKRAALFNACLRAIKDMGVDEFKKASWFGWRQRESQSEATSIVEKKAA